MHKNKRKEKERKEEAQQRAYLIEKEGFLKYFAKQKGCFHCFEFQDLTS